MCLGILSSILESHEEDRVCILMILEDFNATPGSPRFNEMCDILHENSVMFRYMDILPDNKKMLIIVAKHVPSWIILQCLMFCPSPLLTGTPSRMLHAEIYAITVTTLNFDQLPMAHSIEGQKAKHINWKLEDAGFKRRFYQRLDSILDAAPAGLLRVNRGVDANRLNDLLTFMSTAILI